MAIGVVIRFRISDNLNLVVFHGSDPDNDSILNPLMVKSHALDHPKQELELRTCALQSDPDNSREQKHVFNMAEISG